MAKGKISAFEYANHITNLLRSNVSIKVIYDQVEDWNIYARKIPLDQIDLCKIVMKDARIVPINNHSGISQRFDVYLGQSSEIISVKDRLETHR